MSYMYLYNLYTSYFPNFINDRVQSKHVRQSTNTGKPVHMRSLIRVVDVCSMDSQGSNVFSGGRL